MSPKKKLSLKLNSMTSELIMDRFKWSSYLTVLIHVVICQLDFLERDDLFPQLLTGEGWVGMNVKSHGRRRIRFTSLEPTTSMIGVSIPLVVDRHDVH